MIEIVFATRNAGKKKEFEALVKGMGIRVLSLEDFKHISPVVEDGKTFKENAAKKAVEIARSLRKLTVADDSGLEVAALGGAPGVVSSRYAGEHATDRENNKKLLETMKDVPPERRGASFRCAIAVATPEGLIDVVEGSCEGIIGTEERGCNGFGYDSLFIRLEYGKTFAELESSIKNRISHRARAFEKAKIILERIQMAQENK
jgi:XTP/dITP diphosphohydrolase